MTLIERINQLSENDAVFEIIRNFHELAKKEDFTQMNECVRVLSESSSEVIMFAAFSASNPYFSKLQSREEALEKAFARIESSTGKEYAIKLLGGQRTQSGKTLKDKISN